MNQNQATADHSDQAEAQPHDASEPETRRYISSQDRRVRDRARQGLPFVMLVGLIVYFSVKSSIFLSTENMDNTIRQGSVLLVVALGMTFVIVQGAIDLSVGSIATLVGIVVAYMVADWDLGLLAFPLGAALGAAIGVVTGLLVAVLRVPSFLATLGLLSVLAGVGNFITTGSNKRIDNATFSDVVRGEAVLGLPNLLWWALGAFLLAFFAERYTKFGRYSYSIGGGELVSGMAGVPVARYKVYVFTVSGFAAGLAGALLAARVSAGGPGLGEPLMLDAITAIAIGGTALTGGVGGVPRTLLGVVPVTLLRNGLILTQVGAFSQQIITGVVLIVAVALSLDRRRLTVIK